MPDLEYKALAAEWKADPAQEGAYEGYFSRTGNLDDGGDIIVKGAFTKTLQERAGRVKVFYQHDPEKLIGPTPDVLEEDSQGLYAKGRLTLGSFWGREAWALLKDGALTEGSIGYKAIPARTEYTPDGRVLNEVKLYEISPVSLGMNPLTQIAAVKAALRAGAGAEEPMALLAALLTEVKEGRMLSGVNVGKLQTAADAMRAALDTMQGLIDAAQPAPPKAADHSHLLRQLHLLELELTTPYRSR